MACRPFGQRRELSPDPGGPNGDAARCYHALFGRGGSVRQKAAPWLPRGVFAGGIPGRAGHTLMEEPYSLDPNCVLFRLLRHFWPVDQASRPLLAFLTAAAGDPLLPSLRQHLHNDRFGRR